MAVRRAPANSVQTELAPNRQGVSDKHGADVEDTLESLRRLSDEQLLADLRTRVEAERTATSMLIASLAELDARALYVSLGYPSLIVFCTNELHLSKNEAYSRINAA